MYLHRCTKWSMRKWTAWILLGIFLFLVYKSAFFTVKRQNSPPEIEGPVSIECSPGFFNSDGFIETPPEETLQKLSYEDLTCLYHRFVDNVGVLCRNIVRLGKLTDGGWEVCHDQQYRPPKNYLVYSAGINNDFSFDDAIAKQYGCKVHSFDPSMKKKSYRRSEQVFFHNIGISDVEVYIPANKTGWEMRTLGTIKQKLGHAKRRVDVLKMDIEHWEWKVLPQAIASGFLDDVTTLDLELHSWIINKTYIYEPPAEVYLGYLRTLRQLHQFGFRIFLTHKNLGSCQFRSRFGMMRTSCQEIAMVQTKMKMGMQ